MSTFEPTIRGVRRLIDFSLASPQGAHLLFISSAAVVNHLRSDTAIPEALHRVPQSNLDGYAAAKHTCELLVGQAVAGAGLKASVCRVGQIAGPVLPGHEQGMWPKHELIPTVRSTQDMRSTYR